VWIKNSFFKFALATILILIIIFLFGQIGFFLEPFKNFIAIIFTPLLLSGLLYYLFRPLVRLAKKLRVPSTLAILLVFLVFIAIFALIGTYAGSIISTQFELLIRDLPTMTQTVKDKVIELMNNQSLALLFTDKIQQQLTSYVQNAIPTVSGGLVNIISAVSSMAMVLLIVPFMLFFLLKDDILFSNKILNAIPHRYQKEIKVIFKETDKTLSTYIIGQAFLAFVTCVLMYIGYLIIGLTNFSFILAIFVFITAFIPLLGPLIGVVPAILVGLSVNPFMSLKVLIMFIVVQQITGNIIAPNVIGKTLDIHPLTVIIIFLGAASLYGVVGMVIAVPTYAVLKVLIYGAIRIYNIWKSNRVFTAKI
jgi:predicted PurR-regulated permease PerM